MALLNYTTTIDVYKTVGEIQKILVTHGARKIMQGYSEDGHISSICFSIVTNDGEKGIRLPANVPAIYEVLKQQKKQGKIKINIDYAQAERVAWRIVKDWIEAQVAILESQMVSMDEIFLPYMLNKQGQTFFQAYQQKLLE
ncbi:hypothetical protein CS063_17365 [Sporanaerobium hydrogeniformans]|uniref:Uncharacterized protein n=1 Tax=Sporanaerobium hydrogeniformans TaxID=3072179 RepID=A0AC61D721_9FIRM|nr:hypothetical protein [Sporanaerobium hydrogeniformans]PHV69168.1 hypothetical protein CS063_17365 [Sporanaerobium hydrogeniformans]